MQHEFVGRTNQGRATGLGVGTVVGFEKATLGSSEHLLWPVLGSCCCDAADDTIAAPLRVKLERKKNKQTKWMLAPPEHQPVSFLHLPAVGTSQADKPTSRAIVR